MKLGEFCQFVVQDGSLECIAGKTQHVRLRLATHADEARAVRVGHDSCHFLHGGNEHTFFMFDQPAIHAGTSCWLEGMSCWIDGFRHQIQTAATFDGTIKIVARRAHKGRRRHWLTPMPGNQGHAWFSPRQAKEYGASRYRSRRGNRPVIYVTEVGRSRFPLSKWKDVKYVGKVDSGLKNWHGRREGTNRDLDWDFDFDKTWVTSGIDYEEPRYAWAND